MLKKAAISLGLFAEYALFQLLLNLGKIANASNRVKQALGAFLVILTFYSALVTDFDLPAVTVWRTYRGRADCENRIKELKYDFAADSFNMKDFWATEAVLNTVMLAYNLMSLMRQVLLKNSAVKHSSKTVQHTLQTLRYKLFAKPAYLTTESRKTILNLALAMQQRTWMQGQE